MPWSSILVLKKFLDGDAGLVDALGFDFDFKEVLVGDSGIADLLGRLS